MAIRFWRKDHSVQQQYSVQLRDGFLVFHRANGAQTRLDLDHIKRAELRAIRQQIYWLLTDQHGNEALIAESVPGMADVRRYLSGWRGFNYDGLCRFDADCTERLQLWPLMPAQNLVA